MRFLAPKGTDRLEERARLAGGLGIEVSASVPRAGVVFHQCLHTLIAIRKARMTIREALSWAGSKSIAGVQSLRARWAAHSVSGLLELALQELAQLFGETRAFASAATVEGRTDPVQVLQQFAPAKVGKRAADAARARLL